MIASGRSAHQLNDNGGSRVLEDEFAFQLSVLQSPTATIAIQADALQQLLRLALSTSLRMSPRLICSQKTFGLLSAKLLTADDQLAWRIVALGIVMLDAACAITEASSAAAAAAAVDCFSLPFLEAVLLLQNNDSVEPGTAMSTAASTTNSTTTVSTSSCSDMDRKASFHQKRKLASVGSPVSIASEKGALVDGSAAPFTTLMTFLRRSFEANLATSDLSLLRTVFVNRYLYLLVDRITSYSIRTESTQDDATEVSGDHGWGGGSAKARRRPGRRGHEGKEATATEAGVATNDEWPGEEGEEGEDEEQDEEERVIEQKAQRIRKDLAGLRRSLNDAQRLIAKHNFLSRSVTELVHSLRMLRECTSPTLRASQGLCWLRASLVENACFLSDRSQHVVRSVGGEAAGAHLFAHLWRTTEVLLSLLLGSLMKEGPGKAVQRASQLSGLLSDVLFDEKGRVLKRDTLQALLRCMVSLFGKGDKGACSALTDVHVSVARIHLPVVQHRVLALSHCLAALRERRRGSMPAYLSSGGPLSESETAFERFLFEATVCTITLAANMVEVLQLASPSQKHRLGFSFATVLALDASRSHTHSDAWKLREVCGAHKLVQAPPSSESPLPVYLRSLTGIIVEEAKAFMQDLLDTDPQVTGQAGTARPSWVLPAQSHGSQEAADEAPLAVAALVLSAHAALHLVQLICAATDGDDESRRVLLYLVSQELPRRSCWLLVRIFKAQLSLQQQTGHVCVESAVVDWICAVQLLEAFERSCGAMDPVDWEQEVRRYSARTATPGTASAASPSTPVARAREGRDPPTSPPPLLSLEYAASGLATPVSVRHTPSSRPSPARLEEASEGWHESPLSLASTSLRRKGKTLESSQASYTNEEAGIVRSSLPSRTGTQSTAASPLGKRVRLQPSPSSPTSTPKFARIAAPMARRSPVTAQLTPNRGGAVDEPEVGSAWRSKRKFASKT